MNPRVALSKVFARTHRWRATALVLSGAPLTELDRHSIGRLSYALLMLSRTRPAAAQAILHRVIARNINAPAPLLLDLSDMAVRVGDNASALHLLQSARATSDDPGTDDAAGRLLALLEGSIDGTLAQSISEQVNRLNLPGDGRTVTLVPVSSRYLNLWQLWLAQTRRHVGHSIVVLTMDRGAAEALTGEPGVHVIPIEEFFSWDDRGGIHARTRGVLWYIRVLYLRELVRRGFTTLVLDLDAIAIADIDPMLAALPAADIVAQKDHSIPMDVERQLGFVLCCGFVQVRPTEASQRLMDRFAAETARERDDQLALNHILGREGITQKEENAGWLKFASAGVRIVCPSPAQVSRRIDEGTVVRHFAQDGRSADEIRKALGLD